MAEGYERFDLNWQDRLIFVSYQANWLNSAHLHIELRSEDDLPLTHTGYRSCFIPSTEPATESDVRNLVTSWLDEAAQFRDWTRKLENSRQLKLF